MSDSKTTNFTGIGTSPTTGKWKMPAAFLLNESGMVLPGSIDSHETETSRHPLLISQACQAKLGFTKSPATARLLWTITRTKDLKLHDKPEQDCSWYELITCSSSSIYPFQNNYGVCSSSNPVSWKVRAKKSQSLSHMSLDHGYSPSST